MRKFFVAFVASTLSFSTAFAFWPEAADSSLEIGTGYRQDSIKFKTRAQGNIPDFKVPDGSVSDFHWKDLRIWEIGVKGIYVTCDNIYLRAYGDYGWITSGKVRQTDFNLHNHFDSDDNKEITSVEISHQHHNSKKGQVYDASIALGYQFKMCDDSFSIAPLVGYYWQGQHLKIGRHNESSSFASSESESELFALAQESESESESEFSPSSSFSSSSPGEHKYRTRWNGPFLGFDFDYKFVCDWSLFGSYEFHWAKFHAKGHWADRLALNEIHQHSKNGYGHIATLGLRWDFDECWTLALSGEFQWFEARHGRQKQFLNFQEDRDLELAEVLSFKLHNVEFYSGAVKLDLGMVF